MNEPEGMVYAGEANENDCYDTTILTVGFKSLKNRLHFSLVTLPLMFEKRR